jgi:hypothetical protein
METASSQNALTMTEYLDQIIKEEEAATKYLSKSTYFPRQIF